jgi:hypothetical protein
MKKYDLALSFAGEDRHFIEKVADILKDSGISVFYDKFEEANLFGKNLITHLRKVYFEEAKYTVIFCSKNYLNKIWTVHERKSAQDRALIEGDGEYILPVQLDDTPITDIPGIPLSIGYIDLRNADSIYLCKILCEKLNQKIKLPVKYAIEELNLFCRSNNHKEALNLLKNNIQIEKLSEDNIVSVIKSASLLDQPFHLDNYEKIELYELLESIYKKRMKIDVMEENSPNGYSRQWDDDIGKMISFSNHYEFLYSTHFEMQPIIKSFIDLQLGKALAYGGISDFQKELNILIDAAETFCNIPELAEEVSLLFYNAIESHSINVDDIDTLKLFFAKYKDVMKLSTDPQIEHRLAMAENTVATRLARKMTPSQLIVYYEEKIKRFSKKPHLIEQAGIAAFNLAYHLLPLPNTQDDSIKFYDKAIQMLCNSEDIKNVLWLSMAYVNKGDLLLKLQRYSDAYKTLKDVVSKISAYSDLRIKTQLFMAYAKMTACLAFLNERAELENIIESIKKDKDYRNENLSTDMKYWITLSFENYRNFCRINN